MKVLALPCQGLFAYLREKQSSEKKEVPFNLCTLTRVQTHMQNGHALQRQVLLQGCDGLRQGLDVPANVLDFLLCDSPPLLLLCPQCLQSAFFLCAQEGVQLFKLLSSSPLHKLSLSLETEPLGSAVRKCGQSLSLKCNFTWMHITVSS